MRTVFSTEGLDRTKRLNAWRSALREVYLNVDSETDQHNDYVGSIQESTFGKVLITETLLSRQQISRTKSHIAGLDKDCYFFQFVIQGQMEMEQTRVPMRAGTWTGEFFSSTDTYRLTYPALTKAIYVEIPKADFEVRLDRAALPSASSICTLDGAGRVARDYLASLVKQDNALNETVRTSLGECAIDLLVLAMTSPSTMGLSDIPSVKLARLEGVKSYIDKRLGDPNLSVGKIARANSISASYLHKLFRMEKTTVGDWLWNRRLERCFQTLVDEPTKYRTLTDLAYDMGFSSSSHFSNVFKAKFGIKPSDVRASRPGQKTQH